MHRRKRHDHNLPRLFLVHGYIVWPSHRRLLFGVVLMSYKKRDPRIRFSKRVVEVDGCWVWMGTRRPCGYGTFNLDGKQMLAHRVAYMFAHGEFPPSGLFVCHHCDNKACVNPAHFFVGTNSDNMRDLVRKGKHPCQLKTHCKQGHEFTHENTIWRTGRLGLPVRSCRACSHEYNKRRK